MDLQIPLIFVGIFMIASLLLVLIYKFGIKEKSYEEALAEQRQQTQALLGPKSKPKEKKNKKVTKKVKDKPSAEPEKLEIIDNSKPQEEDNAKKSHVEFKEEAEELPVKETITLPKKKAKKDKVKPILIKDKTKENLVNLITDKELPPANHFEELHPKDEFELLRSSSGEELHKQETKVSKTKQTPVESEASNKNENKNQNKKRNVQSEVVQQPEKEEKRVDLIAASLSNGSSTNTGKEKKKKKSEFNTLQQLAGDKDGPNMQILLNLVRKAELSRSEVQILTDLLLNKQHEAPTVLDEWSEGKSDPVQKLKKQLAEKEKLLAEEQEALAGAQAKLREIRAEQQAERSQLQQKIRGFEDIFQNKQVEVTRLHQQLQQLQTQLKEEIMKNRKLCDEHTAFQMQRQQLEMRLAQAQEAEGVIAQLQNENQELSSVNQQLRVELTRISEESINEKERHQSIIVQVNNFQNELEQKNEYIRKLEESRRNTEHNLEKALRQENDFKIEISRLNSAYQQQNEELRRVEHDRKQIQDEVFRLQKENADAGSIIKQYKQDLEKLEEEAAALKESQSNGLIAENKGQEVEILNLSNELSSIQRALQQTEKKYEDEHQLRLSSEDELKEQKEKNNALRTRNWKVIDALNAAESRLKSGNNFNSDKLKSEQDAQRQFVERLFPEIKELRDISSENFQVESERMIRRFVETLQSHQNKETSQSANVAQLTTQIQHYKNTIDDTEKMLSNLQRHIEQEETNWRVQLAAKTAELDAVKKNDLSQLESKISSLEKDLSETEEERNRIFKELEDYKNRQADGESSTTIKNLSEEVNRLKEQLQLEQSRSGDVDVKTQNCTSTNGATLIQYCVSSSSSIASSLSEVSVKNSRTKKKKKKGNGN